MARDHHVLLGGLHQTAIRETVAVASDQHVTKMKTAVLENASVARNQGVIKVKPAILALENAAVGWD